MAVKAQVNYLFNRYFFAKFYLWLYQYCKKRVKNPKWGLMLVFTRFKTVPFLAILFNKHLQVRTPEINHSVFEDLDIDDVIKSLSKDGFYLGIKLPTTILQELLKFASCTDCYGNGEHQLGFSFAEKEKAEEKCGQTFIRGEYFNSNLSCPAIKTLASDPKLLNIAANYLGGKIVYTVSRVGSLFAGNEQNQRLLLENMNFLSLKESTRDGAYFFHYDLDDYQCLKFYFYLTDVDLSSGAHVCVRGSHKKKKLAHMLSLFRRRSDEDIIEDYGAENVVPICGTAGFGFAEDTFCFHKATPPSHRDRLILQIQFTLNDYGNNDLVNPSFLKKCC